MPTPLRPVREPPDRFGAALRRAWAAGEAVLPLPVDAPAGALAPLLRLARDHPGIEHDDAALVVATSGSSGRPKGVVLTHRALRASTQAGLARLGCRDGERWLLALPLHHVAGIQVLLRAWALGMEPLLAAPHDTAALAGATVDHVSLVPTQLARLLDAGAELRRLGTVLLGGGRADPAVLARARAAGARVVVSYGMTETCGGCVYDGVPLDGVEVRVRDDGRILVRGPVLFAGYLDDPAAAGTGPVDADGWFTTGDVGRVVDGVVEVTGRADAVIVSGGENVPLDAVATALRGHPAVADAAATGRTDPTWGEVVVAVVVPADPSSPPDLDTLRAQVMAAHPAPYAPRELIVVDALPRDDLGKLRREGLDELARDRGR